MIANPIEQFGYKAQTYQELWEKCDAYALEHLKGDELNYFYEVTD